MEKPHQLIGTTWKSAEVRGALEKSRAALLNNLSSISTVSHNLLINLANVENLFLVDTTELQKEKLFYICYRSYGEPVKSRAWEWGSRDMMFDFRDGTTKEQRMAILTAAAHLNGGAVHLLLIPWDCTPSSPPQLYGLRLGYFRGDLSRPATAVVVDALSRSSLPFFEMKHIFLPMKDPAIEAQLWRNQRNFMLGSELKRVPATSIRLFICGDPFAGKT